MKNSLRPQCVREKLEVTGNENDIVIVMLRLAHLKVRTFPFPFFKYSDNLVACMGRKATIGDLSHTYTVY